MIRFDNIVGNVNILGSIYDVRTKKLYDDKDGNAQFQTLLDEITSIFNKLTFNIKGTSFVHRKIENKYSLDDLGIFEYYYQLAFTFPFGSNLDALLSQCIKFPNFRYSTSETKRSIEKSKHLHHTFYTKLGSTKKYGKLKSDHSLANSSIVGQIYNRTDKRLLPISIPNKEFVNDLDTTENRFLRFFLEEISAICIRVKSYNIGSTIDQRAKKLQKTVNQYLLLPFFRNVGRLKYIPSGSSVLLKKVGYSAIYHHYIHSKFSFKPILESQERLRHTAGLKNIATLYEIWVFLKIAEFFFGDSTINEIISNSTLKNDSSINSYTWKNKKLELSYNKSYSKKNGGSYSVNLRPDISLLYEGKLYIFDAKYKFNSSNFRDSVSIRSPKHEDIHKMHAYVDAINNTKFAIVVYPGTEILFYTKKIIQTNNEDNLEGVGAVPLSPGKCQNFDKFLGRIISQEN
ncbi:5-methylcytosine restriction system specificity protein McrC [Sphingobacterium mizutaii]|uniref:5-methylcytosine restriction system specificity protein McrC n=1 Tax=Sphingobacterium mizutaii TaxID=1010 RepID=UPI00147468D7|nr:DUF2357 domain-containing protein [Sphingobacterium mizutaii]